MTDIIILNGTSSSGKTTLARALQQHFDAPYMLAGIDKYIFMLPGKYLNPPLWGQVFSYEYEGERIMKICTEALGQQLISAMHHSIAALAESGFNIIVDHVLMEPGWLAQMAELFVPYRSYFIGLHCPLEITEQRERERKDRTLGQAAAQFPVVHAGKSYDFELDTSLADVASSAAQLVQFIRQTPEPRALSRYRA